jgi:hypothetical protein
MKPKQEFTLVFIEHCTESTKAAIRAWMRVMPDITHYAWQECPIADIIKAHVVLTDIVNLAAATSFAHEHQLPLIMWGRTPELSPYTPQLDLPISIAGFADFIRKSENLIHALPAKNFLRLAPGR